ncbi:MAG: low specificity L-threonine aldolase [Verrucomicrobiota bacterium]|nr:low specificity L-threonine aldolase [Verrucomicrobiota bacterium]
MRSRVFASDNYAGICPEAWAALAEANHDHAPAYGNDRWTAEAADRIRDLFETKCEIFFTFNGTSANSLTLATLCRSYHAVICHELSHVETDECGAPEFFSGGSKLLVLPGENGKLTPAAVERMAHKRSDLHFPKVRVLSVTQATEVGTVYHPDELRALGAIVHGLGMKFHMDGARFANAVASLGCAPKEITWQAGVDVLCFGGTKNGLPVGEAIVFFDIGMAQEFEYRCKQAGQLASKMRFMAAPWVGVLRDGAWLRNAANANARAAQMDAGLRAIAAQQPLIKLLFQREANSVFASLPPSLIAGLHARGWQFYDFIAAGGARLMCSWDTTEADVEAFLADVSELAPGCRPGEHPEEYPIARH